MLIDSKNQQVISTLGWVDRGAVWTFSRHSKAPQSVSLSDAQFLSLKQGREDTFAVVHNFDGSRLEISAHRFAEPGHTVSRVSFVSTGSRFLPQPPRVSIEGDTSIWSLLPHAYTAYAFGDFHLFEPLGDPVMEAFDWYNDSYDKGYQGIVGVTEVLGTERVIVSVQRDSNPILYDRETRKVVRKLRLADRGGNPEFQFRPCSTELWASDYDSVVKLDANTYDVLNTSLVQDAEGATRQFIGSFCFGHSGGICIVARPFSGDAVALDCASMRVTHDVKLGGQPLDVAVLDDGLVLARDWKTGALTQGMLSKRKRGLFW